MNMHEIYWSNQLFKLHHDTVSNFTISISRINFTIEHKLEKVYFWRKILSDSDISEYSVVF